MKIGLLDHLGHGNLGDDATLEATMQNIRSRWPGSEMIGLSLNPDDTQKRHGIVAFALRRDSKVVVSEGSAKTLKGTLKVALGKYGPLIWALRAANTLIIRWPSAFFQELAFLAESFRIVRSLDLLVICGGGQLLDSWGGPWKFPYTLFKWGMLARLARTKCYFINVGAGPLRRPLSRLLIKHALSHADYVSLRDDQSRALVQELGYLGQRDVVTDTVYSLEIPAGIKHSDATTGIPPLVGIAPMPYGDPRVYWDKNQRAYDSLIGNLAMFGSWLIQEHHRVALFSTDIWFDAQAIADLRDAIMCEADTSQDRSITTPPISCTNDLLSELSTMDYVVTCRFHGVIFAQLLAKPVIAISHHPKVTQLMSDIGLGEYCLDIHTVTADLLKAKFSDLLDNGPPVKAQMAAKLLTYRDMIHSQFDHLFPDIGARQDDAGAPSGGALTGQVKSIVKASWQRHETVGHTERKRPI